MLSDLLRLAKDATPESRGKLLQRVADVFLDGIGGHSQAELELFCDVILRLLDTTGLEDRASLSRRIAPIAATPQAVAIRLAKDDIAVAAPILEMSPALSQADLMKLARRMPEPHLEAIAKRMDMSPRLSDTLIERGKTRVWRTIASNKNISMSDWGLRTLTKHSLTDAILCDRIAERGDLTPLICEWLLPYVNTTKRLRLQAIVAGSEPHETTDVNLIRQDLRRRLGVYLDTCDAARLWQLIDSGDSNLNDLVIVLIDDKRINDAISLLSKIARRPIANIQTAVFKSAIDDLIQLCVAADLSDHAFLALAHARCRRLRIPEAQTIRWLEAYQDFQRSIEAGSRDDKERSHPGEIALDA